MTKIVPATDEQVRAAEQTMPAEVKAWAMEMLQTGAAALPGMPLELVTALIGVEALRIGQESAASLGIEDTGQTDAMARAVVLFLATEIKAAEIDAREFADV